MSLWADVLLSQFYFQPRLLHCTCSSLLAATPPSSNQRRHFSKRRNRGVSLASILAPLCLAVNPAISSGYHLKNVSQQQCTPFSTKKISRLAVSHHESTIFLLHYHQLYMYIYIYTYIYIQACAHRVRIYCYLFTEWFSCRRSFFDWVTPAKLCTIVFCMLIDCLLQQFSGSIQERVTVRVPHRKHVVNELKQQVVDVRLCLSAILLTTSRRQA